MDETIIKSRARSARYYEKNKQVITEKRNQLKSFSEFLNELTDMTTKSEAAFLNGFKKQYPRLTNRVIAVTYRDLKREQKLTSKEVLGLDNNDTFKAMLGDRLYALSQ